jgi:hypothetical protein
VLLVLDFQVLAHLVQVVEQQAQTQALAEVE